MSDPNQNPLEPREGYYPTLIVGVCSRCGIACTLDIPADENSLRTGDAVMDRKAIRAHCQNCSKDENDLVWFVPRPEKNCPEILKRTEAGLIALTKEIGVSEMRKLGLIP
jgi:hypothetical protein